MNADVVGVESSHKPKFWKLYPVKRKTAHIKAPVISSLLRLNILFLTIRDVDRNAIKNLYALNVKGGASSSASSVMTKVAPQANVVNINPTFAKVFLLIFNTSVDCYNT